MKETGIIFNGEMVRAILPGQKTQTRRVVANVSPDNCLVLRKPTKTKNGVYTHVLDAPQHDLCPFGKVGDRLWVRETFNGFWLDDDAIQEIKDGISKASDLCDYRSDYPDSSQPVGGWTPSIHMPRWASRITLEITGVRVERLNDISEEDCWSEGIDEVDGRFENIEIIDMALKIGCCAEDAKPTFALLWQSIYGEESWDANPWVWAITFKRIKGA
ncbi:hypothetical protein IG609_008900 [Pectobacterium quasiaquaticum]|uniref:Uncharacterized protein n=1 Tax=Pectobacterium quasiaquaticum TaxID=2774015 RepID=A0A9Q2I7V3_9GAMM|nr:hypothetical protein [Pectobacterium quasiaquaticum]URG50594.1 hypothetical protein IG609_008900 [Pectobacterium quasiaquaticum]